jgi:hypothetical protein
MTKALIIWEIEVLINNKGRRLLKCKRKMCVVTRESGVMTIVGKKKIFGRSECECFFVYIFEEVGQEMRYFMENPSEYICMENHLLLEKVIHHEL